MSGHIFLFIAALASVASSAILGGPSSSQPPKCCTPKQISVTMSDMNTLNSNNMFYMDMQIDHDAQKQVMLNYTVGSRTLLNKVVIDYNKRMLYSVVPAYPKYCYKMPLNLPLIRCIPENATYLGSSYLGPMGAGQLPYDGWRMAYGYGTITMAVSKEGCVPLVQGVSFPAGQSQLYFYSGYQPWLTDPSAFHLPDSCLP